MIGLAFLLVGIFLLIKGAEWLVEGGSSLAQRFGVPSIIIGLTVIALGTSLPELFVNVFAAFRNTTEVGLGNIVGSNIANILLVLGVASVMYPLSVRSSTIWREIPFAILAGVVLLIVSSDMQLDHSPIGMISRIDGLIMICFFVVFSYYIAQVIRNSRQSASALKVPKEKSYLIYAQIVGGSIALALGGEWTVKGASEIALAFGLTPFFISATIVALGTSLPELVTSLIALKKKDVSLSVGNVVGSNIFNIFLVLGVGSVIAPTFIRPAILLDMFIVILVSLMLFMFLVLGGGGRLSKKEGTIFLICYVAYIVHLFIAG